MTEPRAVHARRGDTIPTSPTNTNKSEPGSGTTTSDPVIAVAEKAFQLPVFP